jgi:hypothetical protein
MMKIFLATVFIACVALSGCVNKYYYQIQGDQLHIFLHEPKAGKVFFLSSLDQFALHETIKNEKGQWEIIVPSSEAFEYFFIVDGTLKIPTCRQKQKDDFGSENCVYTPGEDI